MRVLLVAPHWLFVYEQYGELSKVINFHPPLGLCALAAAVEAHGHQTKVIDAEGQGLKLQDMAAIAAKYKPDLLGITLTTPILESGAMVAQAIKDTLGRLPVVIGGPHVTLTGAETLMQYPVFDIALCGEAEFTFPQLVDALASGASIDHIPGIHYRDGERIISGPANTQNLDLDSLPLPDRSKLDMRRYVWSVPRRGLRITANIQASRGCPLRCIFCSEDRIYPKAIRWKSVGRVLEELEIIRRTTPAQHLVFLDDTITLNRKWAVELFSEMRRANFGFTWEGETTANRLDEDMVRLMVEAGLVRMNCGIESGDPEILARLGKGVKLEQIAPAFRLLKRHGVETRGSVILGNPYETRATVWRTLRYIWSLEDLDQAYINIATPYPGTILREMALRGEGGAELIDHSYEALRRYGGGVMRVNDLTPAFLNRAQKLGTLVFYSHPRRVVYNLKRSGMRAMIRNVRAFGIALIGGKHAPVQVASGI